MRGRMLKKLITEAVLGLCLRQGAAQAQGAIQLGSERPAPGTPMVRWRPWPEAKRPSFAH